MARTSASSRALTDHDEIRRWAEDRGAKPACVRGTGDSGDTGMIRLDFPGYSGEGKLAEISWDDWFDKFDESGLALLVQERTARGETSNFNKLVNRETVEADDTRSSSRGRQRGQSSARKGQAGGTQSRRNSRSRGRSAAQSRSGRSERSSRGRASGRSSARSSESRGARATGSSRSARSKRSSGTRSSATRSAGRKKGAVRAGNTSSSSSRRSNTRKRAA